MITVNEAIIVEGKYDKITLSNFIDATIITTNGFSVFKDKEKRKLISVLAEKKGLVVVTDSDSSGLMIRNYLKKFCPSGTIKNVYIPQIMGKERRKEKPSKEGFLGVEGMSKEIMLSAFSKSGIIGEEREKSRKMTKNDLFTFGLSGQTESSKKRESFALFSGLPKGMSSGGFLDAVNAVYSYDGFVKAVRVWQSEEDKK